MLQWFNMPSVDAEQRVEDILREFQHETQEIVLGTVEEIVDYASEKAGSGFQAVSWIREGIRALKVEKDG